MESLFGSGSDHLQEFESLSSPLIALCSLILFLRGYLYPHYIGPFLAVSLSLSHSLCPFPASFRVAAMLAGVIYVDVGGLTLLLGPCYVLLSLGMIIVLKGRIWAEHWKVHPWEEGRGRCLFPAK